MSKMASLRAAYRRTRKGQGAVSAAAFDRLRSDIDHGRREAHGFTGLTRLRMMIVLDRMAATDDPDLHFVVTTRDVWELAERAGVVSTGGN